MKIKALVQFLEDYDENEILTQNYDDCVFDTPCGEYMVLTEDEADTRWDESLESYIDECILPEIPEHLRNYFDSEAWKRDARHDGRGHSLSPYDGVENDVQLDGEWFFIYRMN